MAVRLALILLTALAAGCAARPCEPVTITQRVEVPVPVREKIPAELLRDEPAIPDGIFVRPDNPEASSALTPAGEKLLREYIDQFRAFREGILSWDGREGRAN